MSNNDKDIFNKLKNDLLNLDPVSWVERYLTLDGEPFRLSGNGYRPFADIYRYIGVKALEPNSKPVILVKGRQVGGTTMAGALEMYFMGSGIFGNGSKPPIRIMHTFPQLELAAAYSKTKFNQLISSSISAGEQKKGSKYKSHMQSLLDTSSSTNDSLHFKQFVGGNHVWIESTGLDADRLIGRMLCLETELPTPKGFVKLKDLKEGDQLFDEQGNVCNITKLHPIDYNPESYSITFDDGTVVDACGDHLWYSKTKRERNKRKPGNVRTTKEIFNTLKYCGENNHAIPCTKPLNYEEKNLIVDPYIFGLWLGDGDQNGTIESADHENIKKYGAYPQPHSINRKTSKSSTYRIKGLTTKLEKINQFRNTHSGKDDFYNKHIPNEYMTSSFEQRLALLQGLMDSDGHCDKNGVCEFAQIRKDLTYQVFDLILGLGIKAFIKTAISSRYEKKYGIKYRILFTTNLPVFRLERKLDRLKKELSQSKYRYIKSVEKINSKPMRCITVDSPSHLYLITRKYIPTHNTCDVMFIDEIQRTTSHAIGNALKILTTAKYGEPSKGVRVFFGTPRRKGSDFHNMWQSSSQQYFHLGCEKCKKHFPLYTPESDDWEKIWITGFIVKCPFCNHEQDKRHAAERGKWVALKSDNDSDCKMIGFHINQLFMPTFTKENILGEKPGVHPINTERVFKNEVMGEFYQGDASPISPDEIREICGEPGRKFRAQIEPQSDKIVVLGIDYGARSDLEQLANPEKLKATGQSYSTAVVLMAKGPDLLSIEFATKFKRNDMESKKGLIDQLMRQYSIQLAIGDIGFSQDFSEMLHSSYGDRYLVSRAHNKVNNHVKFTKDAFPKEIVFERDFYISELYEKMKKGQIKFPLGDFEKIAWLIEHCSSMEIKPSMSKFGDHSIHYVKGGSPNDGFMALLNAYIAYKFILTSGFSNNNPLFQQSFKDMKNKVLAVTGYFTRRF